MTTPEEEQFSKQALQLSWNVRPHFNGWPPQVQGAALADLLSLWLAGHDPEMLDVLLETHIALVRAMVPVSREELEEMNK